MNEFADTCGGPEPFAYEVDPGEGLEVEERLIVAPSLGIFQPLDNSLTSHAVAEGEAIGTVQSVGAETKTVRSPHAGWLLGLLCQAGERVRAGQPVAWLRAAS